MAAVDDTEVDSIMFKAEDWMEKVMNQFGCEEPVDMTSVLCKQFLLKRTLNLEDQRFCQNRFIRFAFKMTS